MRSYYICSNTAHSPIIFYTVFKVSYALNHNPAIINEEREKIQLAEL